MTQEPMVSLYSKPGCHLCDEAEAILALVARTQPLTLQKVNIESSRELFEEYRYRIPVIRVAGGPSLDWPTTPERVRRALLTAMSAP